MRSFRARRRRLSVGRFYSFIKIPFNLTYSLQKKSRIFTILLLHYIIISKIFAIMDMIWLRALFGGLIAGVKEQSNVGYERNGLCDTRVARSV
jgi:hypothetical protein